MSQGGVGPTYLRNDRHSNTQKKNYTMFRTQAFPLFTFCLACFFPFLVSAQTSWSQIPSGAGSHLLGVHFPDENTGYVAGANGTILKTTDGGDTWSAPLPSQTTDAFYSVFFTDALNGFAVGDNSLIRQTNDGGNTWNVVTSPTFAYFRVVWFLDAQTGFIAGGFPDQDVILKTTDGGATWNLLPPTGNAQTIYGIFFTDANTGFASDFNGNILRTFDGGASWTIQNVASGQLNSIVFTDSNTGYVAGRDGVILKTTDAGNSWFALNSGTNYFLSDIKFLDANTGFATGGDVPGNSGIILRTTDGGNTWTQETFSTGTTSRQFRLFLPSANTAISCGLDGTIFKTTIADPYCCDDLQNSLFDAAFTYDPATGVFCAPASVHPMDLLIWNLGDGNTATWWGSETCFGHGYAAPGSYLVTLIVERVRPNGKTCRVKLAQLVTVGSTNDACGQCAQHLSQAAINVAVDMSNWSGPGGTVSFYPLPDFGTYAVKISWDVNCDGSIDQVTYGNQPLDYTFLCGPQSVCYAIECLQGDESACWGNWYSKSFTMPCFEAPCSCDDLVCDVNNGFNTWEYYGNQMQFTPNSLGPCDKITWGWGDGTANVSAGGDPIWHTYPGPGTYFVCMIVTRTLPDGSTCEMRKHCTSVYINGYFTAPGNDGQTQQQLGIFPNPGAGVFTVSLPVEFGAAGNVLQISSAEGKSMRSIPVESTEMELNLEALPAGLYLLTVADAEGKRLGGAERFVKQ